MIVGVNELRIAVEVSGPTSSEDLVGVSVHNAGEVIAPLVPLGSRCLQRCFLCLCFLCLCFLCFLWPLWSLWSSM